LNARFRVFYSRSIKTDVFFSFTFHLMLEFWRLGSAARSAVFMTPHSSFAFLHLRISSFSVFWCGYSLLLPYLCALVVPKLRRLGFGIQIRMARAALQIGVRELAKLAGVAPMTISRIETGQSSGQGETLAKIRRALETAGVIFIQENDDGPGVRLRKAKGKRK